MKIRDLFKIKKDLPIMTEMAIDNSRLLIIQLPFLSNQVIINKTISRFFLLKWDKIYWFNSMNVVEEYIEQLIDKNDAEILIIIC